MKKAFLPLIIIATGIGWMLTTNGIMEGVNWAIVLVLAVCGILSMINGFTKVSVVLGPMLLIGSVVLVMLQTKRIKIEMGFPVLVISFGVLMLVSRFSNRTDGTATVDDEDKNSTDS